MAETDFVAELGELRGLYRGLDIKVDAIGADVKALLARENVRTGREQQERTDATRDGHREMVRVGLVGGGIGALGGQIMQILAKKLGWL